jgi:hypothetical protein
MSADELKAIADCQAIIRHNMQFIEKILLAATQKLHNSGNDQAAKAASSGVSG